MKDKIKNSKDLAEKIRDVRFKKEIKKQKIITDVRVLRHKVSSLEAGFHAAKDVVNIFRNIQHNQIPPGQKIKNIFINSLLDIVSGFVNRPSGQEAEEDEKEQE